MRLAVTDLMLKPASETGDHYEVTADGDIVGHIMLSGTATQGSTPWSWTIAFPHHGDRSPTEGHEATAEAAMQAFSRSWHRDGEMS
jgi:hypothetical protein